jgi:hypothetical protein
VGHDGAQVRGNRPSRDRLDVELTTRLRARLRGGRGFRGRLRATCLRGFALIALSGLLAVSCSEDDGGDEGTPPTDMYGFATEPPSAYARVDRMGMPAVATALIPTGSKDAYNGSDPRDDADGDFLEAITASVEGLHAALDDDITTLGFEPATTGETIAAAGPLVIPDALTINTAVDESVGFPNGRRITDPVIDITLALVLLDMQTHVPAALVGILNPTQNDKTFLPQFPYLAAPHLP